MGLEVDGWGLEWMGVVATSEWTVCPWGVLAHTTPEPVAAEWRGVVRMRSNPPIWLLL